jgi:hypothetical protein
MNWFGWEASYWHSAVDAGSETDATEGFELPTGA